MGAAAGGDMDEVDSLLEGGDDRESGGIGGRLRSIDRSVLVTQPQAVKAGGAVAGGSALYLFSPLDRSDLAVGPLEHVEAAVGHYFPRDIQRLSDVDGIDRINSLSDLYEQRADVVQHLPDLVGYGIDNAAHYASNYAFAAAAGMAVDRYTDEYEPKKVALGALATAPLYVLAKEGLIEGSEAAVDLESMDVIGDIIMDTAGALHFIYSFHKRKTANAEETDTGRIGSLFNRAGRAYGRAEHAISDLFSPADDPSGPPATPAQPTPEPAHLPDGGGPAPADAYQRAKQAVELEYARHNPEAVLDLDAVSGGNLSRSAALVLAEYDVERRVDMVRNTYVSAIEDVKAERRLSEIRQDDAGNIVAYDAADDTTVTLVDQAYQTLDAVNQLDDRSAADRIRELRDPFADDAAFRAAVETVYTDWADRGVNPDTRQWMADHYGLGDGQPSPPAPGDPATAD